MGPQDQCRLEDVEAKLPDLHIKDLPLRPKVDSNIAQCGMSACGIHLDVPSLQLRDVRKIFSLRKVDYNLFANEMAIPIPSYLWASIARLGPLRSSKTRVCDELFSRLLVDQLLISAIFEEYRKSDLATDLNGVCHSPDPSGIELRHGISVALRVTHNGTDQILTSHAHSSVWYDHNGVDPFGVHLLVVCAAETGSIEDALSQLAACMGIVHQRKMSELATEQTSKRPVKYSDCVPRVSIRGSVPPLLGKVMPCELERGSEESSSVQAPKFAPAAIHPANPQEGQADPLPPLLQRKSLDISNRASVTSLRKKFEHAQDLQIHSTRAKAISDFTRWIRRPSSDRGPTSFFQTSRAAELRASVHGMATDGRIFHFAQIDRSGWLMLGSELSWGGSDSARIYTILRLIIREAVSLVPPKN